MTCELVTHACCWVVHSRAEGEDEAKRNPCILRSAQCPGLSLPRMAKPPLC
jgi:hypothetical protein